MKVDIKIYREKHDFDSKIKRVFIFLPGGYIWRGASTYSEQKAVEELLSQAKGPPPGYEGFVEEYEE